MNITTNPSAELIRHAAALSSYIYNQVKKVEIFPCGFETIHRFDGFPADCRVANWSIYASRGLQTIYVVFRGSTISADWVVNASCVVPVKHKHYNGVAMHTGYHSELAREYEDIRDILRRCFSEFDWKTLVFSGHSKGGALAQLCLDHLFNDSTFTGNVVGVQLLSITFAAPMIFWFTDSVHEQNLLTRTAMHNYIVKGDPIPVVQLLFTHNMAAVRALGGLLYTTLGIESRVTELEPYLRGYRPVGNIYVATAIHLSDLHLVEYTLATLPSILSNWDCVTHNKFSFKCHKIANHYQLTSKEFLASMERRKNHTRGLYVENNSNRDILVIFTHPLYNKIPFAWASVGRGKMRYINAPQSFYTVLAKVYDPAKVPSLTKTMLNTALAPLRVGYIKWGIAAIEMALKKNRGKLHGVYCNGRTLVITNQPYLELNLISKTFVEQVPATTDDEDFV